MKWGRSIGLACMAAMHIGGVVADDEIDILRMDANEYAGVKGVNKETKVDGWWFLLEQAYRIEGRDMGYPKPVGIIKRLFFYECGSTFATLAITNAQDMGLKPLKLKASADGERTPLKSDPDLKRAAHYVCGAGSAKLPRYPGPAKGNPNDDKILACSIGDAEPLFITINEPVKSVNGGPALFRPGTIKFPHRSDDGSIR